MSAGPSALKTAVDAAEASLSIAKGVGHGAPGHRDPVLSEFGQPMGLA
jgi:hypothetical protein